MAEFEKLKQLIGIEKGEKKDEAKLLWNLIVEIEQTYSHDIKTPKKNISSRCKELLYDINGVVN